MANLAEQFEQNPEPAGFVRVDAAAVTAEVTFYDSEVAEILRQVPEGRRAEFFAAAHAAGSS